MKRVGEKQQAVAGKSVRCEHRSRASTHRPSAEEEGLRRELAAGMRSHRGDAFLQARHRIRTAGTLLLVEEIEPNDVKPAAAQRLGPPEHAAVAHVTAGAVRENKEPAAGRRQRGLEDRGGLLFADSDPPRGRDAHGGWDRVVFLSLPWFF